MHTLATDPTVPASIRRAFARVCCQIVRTFDDGSEGVINMTSLKRAEAERAEHAKRIGRKFASGARLVSVTIRGV